MDQVNERRWLKRQLKHKLVAAMGPAALDKVAGELVTLLERPVARREVSIQFSLRLHPNLHLACVDAAHAAKTPINKWMVKQLQRVIDDR